MGSGGTCAADLAAGAAKEADGIIITLMHSTLTLASMFALLIAYILKKAINIYLLIGMNA